MRLRRPVWHKNHVSRFVDYWVVPVREYTNRKHWAFTLAQVGAAGLAMYWWRHLPVPGYCIGVLAVLAAVMTVHGDMKTGHKIAWMLLIGAFLFLEFRAIDKDRAEFSYAEMCRRLDENAQFQGIADNIDASIKLGAAQFDATMSGIRQSINTMIGGDSICWLTFAGRISPQALPMVIQRGNFPLHSVTARMVDLNKFNRLVGKNVTLDNMFTADTNWQIGDLGVASSRMLGRFVFDDGTDKRNFNIFFTGTNGFWTELLRLRKVNGTWLEAVRVTRDKVEGSKLSSEKAFEQVEAGYPRVSGKVDWGN